MSQGDSRDSSFADRALGGPPNPLDNIDQVFRHTARRTWLGVLGIALLVGAGVLWTAVAQQKVVVDAPAVVVPEQGVFTAGEFESGTVASVAVVAGDEVTQGEVLAEVQLPGSARSVDVRSPVAGRVLAVDVRAGDVSPAGSPMFRIVPPGDPVVVALYPAADVSRLAVGQHVSVTVNGVAPARYGRAVGQITAIGSIPVSDQRLRQLTGDSSLLGLVVRLGPLREVTISLDRDSTASGVRWEGGGGPAAPIAVGTRATAGITVGERTLLDRAFG
jgi:multidrug resistance efflux pump